jgi:hypothetical protein
MAQKGISRRTMLIRIRESDTNCAHWVEPEKAWRTCGRRAATSERTGLSSSSSSALALAARRPCETMVSASTDIGNNAHTVTSEATPTPSHSKRL